MPLSTSISLTPSVQNQITSAASVRSVDSIVLSAIAQVISGGRQFFSDNSLVVNSIGGVGVMGVSKNVAQALGYDAELEDQNIQAGAAYMAELLKTFTGNYPYAVAAYFSGTAPVFQYNGVPPSASTQAFVYNVTNLAQRAGSYSMTMKNTLENQTVADPSKPATTTGQLVTPVGQSIDPKDTTKANSGVPVVQIDTGLDETPWFTKAADGSLVTGNPRIRGSVQPVSFMIYLDRARQTYLHDPSDNTPIVLQLNTSIKTFELQSKHVFNRTPSRTGMHITFWGMQPDLINGTGSTGVFMNQFGLTDFFSVATITDDVKQLVTNGFSRSFKPVPKVANTGTTGEVFTAAVSGNDTTFNLIVNNQTTDPNAAFRVAAQDAFMEFMKLFQMNGNIWFFNQNYKGSYTGQQQQNVSAWSESTGASSLEQVARNNDVMTRGFVAMRYKNNVYLGYFKSLQWTQDAEKPFSWDFSFVFQVERTISALYWPNPAVSQFGSALRQTAGAAPQPTTSNVNGIIA